MVSLVLCIMFFACMVIDVHAVDDEKVDHRSDICYVIFNGKNEEELDEEQQKSLDLLATAIAFSIDENGLKLAAREPAYNAFVGKVSEKNPSIGSMLPPCNEDIFPPIGWGRVHRVYCHNGFYCDNYGRVKFPERWVNARDKILVPTAAAAFNLDNSPQSDDYVKAEIMAIVAYYTHIMGDVYEGDVSLMRIKSIPQALQDLNNAISAVVMKSSDTTIRSFSMPEVTSITQYEDAKDYMKDSLRPLIDPIVGTEDQTVVQIIIGWFGKIFK